MSVRVNSLEERKFKESEENLKDNKEKIRKANKSRTDKRPANNDLDDIDGYEPKKKEKLKLEKETVYAKKPINNDSKGDFCKFSKTNATKYDQIKQDDDNSRANSKKMTVANMFNADSSSEDESMPLEAKMRMKNIGKDTPTASGPNSFGKTGMGFCNRQRILEKELEARMEAVSGDNEHLQKS